MTQTTPSHSQAVEAAEKQVFETWVKTVWRPDDGASLLDKEFPRFAFAAFKAGRELLAAEAGKYPWITWKGSRDSAECPISPEAVVDMRFRAGDEHFGVLAGEYSWWDTGEEDDVVAYRFRAALTSQQEVAAPVGEFDDWPDFNEQAMGCGLEDRNITDRYEAMRYGWDEAMERVGERFEQFLAASRVPVAQGEAVPDLFTQGVNAAAEMLDKMADDFANEYSSQDPDTGVYEFGRGGKEDHYNTLRELADDIRSIVLGNPAPEQATTGSGQDSSSVHLGSGDRGEVHAPGPTDAAWDVLAERGRQVGGEGWTPEHDDHHENGELAEAAAVYAVPNWKRRMRKSNPPTEQLWPDGWPWELADFKPKDDRRNLVKAGALILAEIERLDRAAILSTASPAGEGEVKL